MKIGQRVLLEHLLYRGTFPGEIVKIDPFKTCVVKLDRQDVPVYGVLYFDKRPDPNTEISSAYWQFCYPEDKNEN